MPELSNAVGLERVANVTGYKIEKGAFNEETQNLPQRIAIICESNHANQGAETSPPTDISEPFQVTSRAEGAAVAGWGSPLDIMLRVLFPNSGGQIGGIPVWVYLQPEADGATAKEVTLTVSGTAEKNVTHTLLIGGRGYLEGGTYDINIAKGDDEADIAEKIKIAVAKVLDCPMQAALNSPIDADVILTTKWNGKTAQGVTVSVDTNGNDAGISYSVATTSDGTGTPDIQPALDAMDPVWNTLICCGYGTEESIMDKLEAWNGRPDPETPTGRYTGTIMKPALALIGSVDDDPSDITDERSEDNTIAICPAPLSPGLPMEAAANYCALFARVSQDTPHLDIMGKYLPDMPVATEPIAMNDYNNRDEFVKKGCSTAIINAGRYQAMDFVTTYHPEGEMPPQFAWCRNVMIDLNTYFTYAMLEELYVKGHVIANDKDVVKVDKVIKPKQWKQILSGEQFALGLVKRGLHADPDFLKANLQVQLSPTNPDRLGTKFKYKRTGLARITATTAVAGFNFGTA